MTDQGQRGPARPGIDFACFELAGETWAVPIANVREILASPRITPLPDAPSVIEGVVDLGGTLIPIVDLESLLRGEREAKATPAAARPRTVVVEARGMVVGFRVERATQVVRATPETLERVPELVREVGCRIVGTLIRRAAGSPILLLELDALIDRVLDDRRAGMPGGEAAA